ncbi:two-component system regulatory protein YycI [Dethiothermospora halolimnae]|uniref:two-component system regulatory protein YycI n=1 Tax=Dethiothermospora halolimnae TaxID=3114390 RepID=UPI003CCB7C0F
MDWAKAKSVLIVAFLITNLILGYVLIDNREVKGMSKEQFISEIKKELNDKGIIIQTEIPSDIPPLPMIDLKYDVYNPKDIAKKFLGEYIKESIGDNIQFRNEKEVLRLSPDNKTLFYESHSDIKKYDTLTKDKLEEIVTKFLKNKGFRTDDFKLDYYKYNYDDEVYVLKYTKVYDNRFVERTNMTFEINKFGIKKFKRHWVKSIEESDRKFSIIDPSDALLRLLSKQEHYNKIITDIDLCYYLPEELSYKNPRNPIKITSGPAWRIKFKDGTKEFLDQYENK